MALSPKTTRFDAPGQGKPCGGGHINRQFNCSASGNASRKSPSAITAGAVGLGVGLATVGVGLLAFNAAGRPRPSMRGNRPTPPSSSALTIPRGPRPSGGPITPVRVRVEQPRLPGSSPRALLAPGAPRKSKTQRMRANTAAAMRNAEGRIAQTAREEVRRIAQIGNTMAATGEATGMAVKTGLRELRLRTEAARRRFEPGYRATPSAAPQPPKRLSPGDPALQLPFTATAPLTPEAVATQRDPRTGQPRRRRAQGFGRRDGGAHQLYGTQYIDPARPRSDADGKKYTKTVTNPETGRKNKVRYGAKGYRIAPGTPKGDRYCARSFGDMKSEGFDCSGADRNTPLCLSRAKWKCSGKTSRR